MDPQINLLFADVFDALNQFVFILDDYGKVIRANQTVLVLVGLSQEQILGMPLWELPWSFFSKADLRSLKQAVNQTLRGDFVRRELVIRQRGDLKLDINFTFRPILDGAKMVKFILAEGRDETFSKQTSEELHRSEARFQTIYEKAGIGILLKRVDGGIFACNPAFQVMLGYSLEELVLKNYLEITLPKDRAASRKLFNELVSGQRTSYSTEKRYLHKDGRIIWGKITTSIVSGSDPGTQYVIAIVENITSQKQIESELLALKRRLMHGREMERMRVAQDLHDGPLQELIAISFQGKELKSSLASQEERDKIESMQVALQKVSRSIRVVCGELRPPTLVPFGLEKTIRSHAAEFQAAHPEIQIDLNLADDDQQLSELVRIVLFRIYQEAMHNIQRHSHASQVSVRFELKRGRTRLEIRDNGKGFAVPEHWVNLANEGHLGLVSAMEQAREVGGSLMVTSQKKHGTVIRAILPLKEDPDLIRIRGKEDDR
jgi:PAS domain S-box-containing protein